MFASGAGVEVVENAGHLTARVYMPWNFIVSILCAMGLYVLFNEAIKTCILTNTNQCILTQTRQTEPDARSVRQLELRHGR